MSIDRDHPLAVAAREVNTLAEEQGLDAVMEMVGLDRDSAVYLAQQRALRTVMISRGEQDRVLGEQALSPQAVELNAEERELLLLLSAAALDGIVIGYHAAALERSAD